MCAVIGGYRDDSVKSDAVEGDPGRVNRTGVQSEGVGADPLLIGGDAEPTSVIRRQEDGSLPVVADRSVGFERSGQVDGVVQPGGIDMSDVPVVVARWLDHEVERQNERVQVALRVERHNWIGRVHPLLVARKDAALPSLAAIGRVVPDELEQVILGREEGLRHADDVLRVGRIHGQVAFALVVGEGGPALRADVWIPQPGRADGAGLMDGVGRCLDVDDSSDVRRVVARPGRWRDGCRRQE